MAKAKKTSRTPPAQSSRPDWATLETSFLTAALRDTADGQASGYAVAPLLDASADRLDALDQLARMGLRHFCAPPPDLPPEDFPPLTDAQVDAFLRDYVRDPNATRDILARIKAKFDERLPPRERGRRR
jgi:hypothetical protein